MAILKYIGRRLLVLIPVLLGISLAAFLLGRIAPGDPVDDALFRIGIEFPTEEDRADMRAELGLDRGLASLVLPAVALSAANVGSTSRFTRGNILAQLGEQYIVVANAKGLSQRAVMVGHAFRNSLVPIITLIGNYFGGILGGSTIIENIFAIPGLGSYVLSAIQNRDYPVIQGYVLITGTTFVLVTLAIDLLYIAVNPKIRLQGGEA